MKDTRGGLSYFLQNNPTGNHTDSRVGGKTKPFDPYREQVCRDAPCMEMSGSVPVPPQFWASWRAVVGFCEVGVPLPHFTPATDSCGMLAVPFTCKPVYSWAVFLTSASKDSQLSWERNLRAQLCRQGGRGLLCPPSEQPPCLEPPLHTQPPCPGSRDVYGTSSIPGKIQSWAKKTPLCLGKANLWPIYDWSQPSIWWLPCFSRYGISRHDNWWTCFLE